MLAVSNWSAEMFVDLHWALSHSWDDLVLLHVSAFSGLTWVCFHSEPDPYERRTQHFLSLCPGDFANITLVEVGHKAKPSRVGGN